MCRDSRSRADCRAKRGVRLNIRTPEEAREAYDGILSACRAYAPNARLDGVLVQKMAPSGAEVILGVKNDRQLGPLLLV